MSTRKTATNGAKPAKKATTRTKTQPKKAKKELTANELTYIAWQKTYANRHKRLG